MTNQEKVEESMRTAEQSVPSSISYATDDVCKLRARLILEEALETIVDGLGITSFEVNGTAITGSEYIDSFDLAEWLDFMKSANFIKDQPTNLNLLADGIADCEVVNLGTASAFGIKMQPIFDEVHRSNMSKFIGGILKSESGKYLKGPHYTKPDIEGELRKQGYEQ